MKTKKLAPNSLTREEFVAAIENIAGAVWDFHNRWGFGSGMFRGANSASVIRERAAILDEEVRELAEAVDSQSDYETEDEAADVLFVAIGHIEALGRIGIDAVARVATKNAHKTEATHAIRPDTGKLLPIDGKPHKWTSTPSKTQDQD